MGGLGSGGWNHSGRATVEGAARLNIDALKRAGGLRVGSATVWRWSRGDEAFASICVRASDDLVRLCYSVTEADAQTRSVDQPVRTLSRNCRYGGARRLFCCPFCNRAALNLHLARGRFACRRCSRLTYASRRERQRDRCCRAANKLRHRLGGEPGLANAIAARPKGMWRRTYAHIVDEIERREAVASEELAGWIMKMGGSARRAGFW